MRWLRHLLLLGLLGGAAGVAGVVYRHWRGSSGRAVPGGVLMDDARAYDAMSGWLLGSFFRPIAADVAAQASSRGRVLEVGCGPGRLAMRLARDHGLDVVAVDLDPAMIDRARTHAAEMAAGAPSFMVADVAALPFDDQAFDLVVSTMSMHHWDDPAAGLAEIARVLKPGGRALIWDLGPRAPLHGHVPDPAGHLAGAPLAPVSDTPWRWPFRFSFTRRIELQKEPALPAS